MRKFAALVLAVFAAAALVAAAQAAKRPGLRLTPLSSIQFPDRAFVLSTTTGAPLAGAQIGATEDGLAVRGLKVVPASETVGRTFGVMLVIDASNSMRGAAIQNAIAAARAFAAHSLKSQALGLITFNRRVRLVSGPTTDRGAINAALQRLPKLAEKTRLWDATALAIDTLRREKITAGTVLLLTDGADIGSRLGQGQVVAKARAAGVRLYAVGLRSRQFRPAPLESIARSTHAAYAEAASPRSLTSIYSALSSQLARDYLIRYESTAKPGENVHVVVTVAGFDAPVDLRYVTPIPPVAPPFHRTAFDRFVTSPGSVGLLGLLAALLAWLGIGTILKPGRSTLRSRVGEFVTTGSIGKTDPRSLRLRQRLLSHVLLTVERTFQRAPWWERFKEELDIAEFPVRPVPLAVATSAASVALALLAFVSPVLILMAFAPPLLVRAAYKEKLRRRRQAFEEQLPENLTVLASSLRAGHSFVGSLASVLEQAEEPSRSELRRAVSDEQLGVPVEDALLRVAERMNSVDLEQVALVASLQRQTGGNTAEVLDAVVNSIRERFQLRRLVRALTAQGRMARWILTALPIVVLGWISLVSPNYISPLFHTSSGQVLVALAAVMIVTGSFAIKRITEIEI